MSPCFPTAKMSTGASRNLYESNKWCILLCGILKESRGHSTWCAGNSCWIIYRRDLNRETVIWTKPSVDYEVICCSAVQVCWSAQSCKSRGMAGCLSAECGVNVCLGTDTYIYSSFLSISPTHSCERKGTCVPSVFRMVCVSGMLLDCMWHSLQCLILWLEDYVAIL